MICSTHERDAFSRESSTHGRMNTLLVQLSSNHRIGSLIQQSIDSFNDIRSGFAQLWSG